jgi:hypothetical protein
LLLLVALTPVPGPGADADDGQNDIDAGKGDCVWCWEGAKGDSSAVGVEDLLWRCLFDSIDHIRNDHERREM